MAKKKNKTLPKRKNKIIAFFKSQQTHLVFGVFLVLFAIFLFSSFVSFFSHWYQDQSQLVDFTLHSGQVKNFLGKIGASLSHFFIYKGFGISAFVIPLLILISGLFLILDISLKRVRKMTFWLVVFMIWLSITLALIFTNNSLLSGVNGFELNSFLQDYIGKIGVVLLLTLLALSYLIFK